MLSAAAAGAFAFVGVFLGVAALGFYLSDRSAGDRRRTAGRIRGLREADAHGPAAAREPAGGLWSPVYRLGSFAVARERMWLTRLNAQLQQAGYVHPSAPVYFLGARFVLIVVLAAAAAGVAARFAPRAPWQQLVLWGAAGGAAGFLAPSYVLAARVRKRRRILKHALADALDIMVMCVESGASLNAAINWVTDEVQSIHPLLGDEFVLIQQEMHLGRTAAEAFRTFADRTGVDDVRDLAAVLLQSERYGASVGKALRVYADGARQERQMWAEEMAQKAAVKIVFPMLLCIFPAMFIVLLGPAAMQMSKLFAR